LPARPSTELTSASVFRLGGRLPGVFNLTIVHLDVVESLCLGRVLN
jgi:hypothetical protein